MRRFLAGATCATLWVFVAVSVACAQSDAKRIALKSGESAELRPYFFIVNCQSIMVGQPQLEVLEGPEEVLVTLKEGPVRPRGRNCAKPVPGGTVIATAKEVAEPKEANLTIRLRFNTKGGERQGANTYVVTLLPAGALPQTNMPTNTSTAPSMAQ
jgi:hypothetical protein